MYRPSYTTFRQHLPSQIATVNKILSFFEHHLNERAKPKQKQQTIQFEGETNDSFCVQNVILKMKTKQKRCSPHFIFRISVLQWILAGCWCRLSPKCECYNNRNTNIFSKMKQKCKQLGEMCRRFVHSVLLTQSTIGNWIGTHIFPPTDRMVAYCHTHNTLTHIHFLHNARMRNSLSPPDRNLHFNFILKW